MTTLEYAIPVGCTIASGVLAAFARAWAKDAAYNRDLSRAYADRACEDANRVTRQSQQVHDLHDCVMQTVRPKPYGGPSDVNFDLPPRADPEGRTGECR